MLESIKEFLNFDRMLGIGGLLVGIIAILCSWIFYLWTFSAKRLISVTRHTLLIARQRNVLPGEVTVLFDGEAVSDLRKLNVVIWNSGRVPIDGTDLVSEGGIKISLPAPAKVLKMYVERSSRAENKVVVVPSNEDRNIGFCSFEYLDSNDGFNVGILSTGPNRQLTVEAVIKGIPSGIRDMTDSITRESSIGLDMMGSFLIFFLTIGATIVGSAWLNFSGAGLNWLYVSGLFITVALTITLSTLLKGRRHPILTLLTE